MVFCGTSYKIPQKFLVFGRSKVISSFQKLCKKTNLNCDSKAAILEACKNIVKCKCLKKISILSLKTSISNLPSSLIVFRVSTLVRFDL